MPDEITTGLWVKDPRLRLQDEISKVPGYRFNILKVKGTEKTKGKGSMAPWTYRSSIFRSIGHLIHE
ncbi:unnamed protein product [Rhizophagus irregularis]|nr:unnamed protein product [Rhizophagus irregularis]